ncbi:hypothetical protein GF376_01885, partial [Candidatus Peregrinibacteria bacterium]|nr:hypothetical protein [Candidatus Peregrinibacteria bacterium]
ILISIFVIGCVDDAGKDMESKQEKELSDSLGEDTNEKIDEGESQDKKDESGDAKSSLVADDNLDLMIAKGFDIDVLVDNVDGARVLTQPDELGNRWLSRTKEGVVSLLVFNDQGGVERVDDIFTNLNNPHGIAIDPQDGLVLYIAEEDKVSRVRLYTEGGMETLVELPEGGRHFTRTLHFGPDGRLYVSIGSSCDTCFEEDERRASIYVMDKDGSNFEQYASGLRNAVFLANNYINGEIWVTEMGRDFLGDDLPPDEINVLKQGGDYGWPSCYGKNIQDEQFEEAESCDDKIPAKINIQAHSAPLGLAFMTEEGWPEAYWYDLMVAYHGSWNRDIPTGYKIKRFILNDQGDLLGREDFIEGWLQEDESYTGRPVDVLIEPAKMYITDDYGGKVYIVTKKSNS